VDTVRSLQPFREVFVTRAGCTVSSHCGPGTIGVLYITK
jgi:fatty acid-binding protein DegV